MQAPVAPPAEPPAVANPPGLPPAGNPAAPPAAERACRRLRIALVLGLVLFWATAMALLKVMNPTPDRLAKLPLETLNLSFKGWSLAGYEAHAAGGSKLPLTTTREQPFISPWLLDGIERFDLSKFSPLELTACDPNREDCAVPTGGAHTVSIVAPSGATLDVRRFSPLAVSPGQVCDGPFRLSLSSTIFELRSEGQGSEKCAATFELKLGPGDKRLRAHGGPKDVPGTAAGEVEVSAEWQRDALVSVALRPTDSSQPLYTELQYATLEGLLAAPFVSSPGAFETCQAEAGRQIRISAPGLLHRIWREEPSGTLAARIDATTPMEVCSPGFKDCEPACRFPSSEFWHGFGTFALAALGAVLALGWLGPKAKGRCDPVPESEKAGGT